MVVFQHIVEGGGNVGFIDHDIDISDSFQESSSRGPRGCGRVEQTSASILSQLSLVVSSADSPTGSVVVVLIGSIVGSPCNERLFIFAVSAGSFDEVVVVCGDVAKNLVREAFKVVECSVISDPRDTLFDKEKSVLRW